MHLDRHGQYPLPNEVLRDHRSGVAAQQNVTVPDLPGAPSRGGESRYGVLTLRGSSLSATSWIAACQGAWELMRAKCALRTEDDDGGTKSPNVALRTSLL